ncbi:aldo/keto reductase [Parvularcula sp. IMCC14364]|uniref:aldo/keto reductase n=1 Tax=Parvularcula sp. IMCC14364 TaxID=3067902 RepID=UPI002740E84E|nr:aldo/keto reductase [Parvularcula sp. IMCC14364]
MKFSRLGSSGLDVSRVCLGSMTWGVQNTQSDADAQIDYALEQGVNFIDTAEMYAVPPSADTYGTTEAIIGNWLSRHPDRRKDIVLATKIAGPGFPWVRDGDALSGAAVIEAVDDSLKRLQTDYIDLYQLHWPGRVTPHFGKHWPNNQSFAQVDIAAEEANMLDVLQGLDACVKAGKVRHCGLSDDTTWGIATYLKLAERHDLPRMVSIQNEFNLLMTKDWPYLVEHCAMENIAYLPWSPLATGILTGKYRNGALPKGSRLDIMGGPNQRHRLFRDREASHKAVEAYCQVADKHGVTPAQLALIWCDNVSGVTSSIIGATSMVQLKEDIAAFDMPLTDGLREDIDAVFQKFPQPF